MAEELLLRGNKFGDEGLLLLSSCIQNSRLQTLELSNNGLNEKSLHILGKILSMNSTIKTIYFIENSAPLETLEDFKMRF